MDRSRSSSTIQSLMAATGFNVMEPRNNDQEDAVTLTVRKITKQWTLTVCFWLLSFVMLMLIYLTQDSKATFPSWSVVCFLPMWCASCTLLGQSLVFIKDLCTGKRLLPQGAQRSEASGRSAERLIQYDSLPLMRKIFLYGVLSAFYALFALISQFLLYVWCVSGSFGMWYALIPTIFVIIIFVAYAIMVRTVTDEALIMSGLLLLDLLFVGLRFRGQIVWSWGLVLLPVLGTEGYVVYHLYNMANGVRLRQWFLTEEQWRSWYEAGCAVLFSIVGTSITMLTGDNDSPPISVCVMLPKLCWLGAIVLMTLVVLRTFNSDCAHLAESRGYSQPQPLTHETDEGWIRVPAVDDFLVSPILGRVAKLEPPIHVFMGGNEAQPLVNHSGSSSTGSGDNAVPAVRNYTFDDA
jgi:hypothetical protein